MAINVCGRVTLEKRKEVYRRFPCRTWPYFISRQDRSMGCAVCKTATVIPAHGEQHRPPVDEVPLLSFRTTTSMTISDYVLPTQRKEEVERKPDPVPADVETAAPNVRRRVALKKSVRTSPKREVRSTSSDSKRRLARPKAARPLAVESFPSESAESVAPNDSSADWTGGCSSSDGLVSSPASTRTKAAPVTQHVADTNDFPSDSDESYPVHRSFVTSSSSSCSNTSVRSKKLDFRPVDEHASNVPAGQDTIHSQSQFNSNPLSCTSSERDERTTHGKTAITSESRNPPKSDIHPRTIVYETSYESEVEQQLQRTW